MIKKHKKINLLNRIKLQNFYNNPNKQNIKVLKKKSIKRIISPIPKQPILKKNNISLKLNNKIIQKNSKIINPRLLKNKIFRKKIIKKVRKIGGYKSLKFEGEPFLWESEKKGNIIMTVSIPLFKTQKIIPLVFESIKNQKGINFFWEMIVYEEYGNSLNILKSYIGKFPGCIRILYRKVKPPVNISTKWFGMVKDASATSKIYVLQSSDDYAPTKRYMIHFKHFNNKRCLISTQRHGYFINVKNNKQVLYNGNSNGVIHLNPALRTSDVRGFPDFNLKKYIHSIVLRTLQKKYKRAFKAGIFYDMAIDKNDWKTGFFTDGFNSLSLTRKKVYLRPTIPYTRAKINVLKMVPKRSITVLNKVKK